MTMSHPYPGASFKGLQTQLVIWQQELSLNRRRLRESHRSIDDMKICERNTERAAKMVKRIHAQMLDTEY